MSNKIQAELVSLKEELAQLKAALDSFFSMFPRERRDVWKRVKSGDTETPADTTLGRNLPAPVVKTVLNNVGGAMI